MSAEARNVLGEGSQRSSGKTAPESGSIEPDTHIPALDGVRGVAILLVLLLHFSVYGHGLAPSGLLIDRLYYRVAGAGWIGVDLFFVLSGFLITGILYDSKQSRHYFRNFYARRVLRIFPLYYGLLVLLLVVLPLLRPEHSGLRLMARDGVWYWSYLSNVKIALDGWPPFGALGHFWSLAVEEQFYLLWPVLVLKLGRRQLQLTCLVCVIGAVAVRVVLNAQGNNPAAFVLMPARIDSLAVGAYLAVAARGPGGLRGLSRLALPVASLLCLAVLVISVLRRGFAAYDPLVSTIGHTLIAFLFAAVLVLALTAAREAWVARAFGSSFLRFFGRYSYGIYVFHHPLLLLNTSVASLAVVPSVFGSQLLRQLVFLVVTTGVSVSIAFLSWHLFEKRFLMLKVLFPRRAAEPVGARPAGSNAAARGREGRMLTPTAAAAAMPVLTEDAGLPASS
jgi:peptidoglycan/LPS O-acetylase OafA/YrhL